MGSFTWYIVSSLLRPDALLWIRRFDQYCLKGDQHMNWDRLEGEWKQRRGKAVHHWGKMMNDELAAIAGKYEELVGRLQSRYGIAREEAQLQVGEFKKMVEQLKQSNKKLIEAQNALTRQKDGPRQKARSASLVRKRKRPTPKKAAS
jgi:uncharacterized protein YjbJ (UPF0337 family)